MSEKLLPIVSDPADFGDLPYRPGFKRQLKAQDVTAKSVRSDILRKVPKNILFCIKLT